MNQVSQQDNQEPVTAYIKPWARGILVLAGIYNAVWGLLIYFFPEPYFTWLSKGVLLDYHPLVKWRGLGVLLLGMLLLVGGFGTAKRWWVPAVALGLKVLGAGLVFALLMDFNMTRSYLFQLIMSDLVWVLPLYLCMRQYRAAL